ncbi:predicted protein [Uncinocarpus reesii 1704]|uniref:Uncharacterized protein n=1 Tax=Uncinocarpus reesii (strain UAMH 1704) TaxID=336963 RepID=C4JUU1_UNCRE|nr:uncharacterized protein UREG_04894 [Uncinocarpus reesii 1704]EEP80052.1 predicted protein [Uncinocarpus reesii 1704]
MESQCSQTVSQPPEISCQGPVIVHLPVVQPKTQSLQPQGRENVPSASAENSPVIDKLPTSLPYADVARGAIAEPGPLLLSKKRVSQGYQFEDPIAYPTLSESRIRAASQSKRAFRRRSKHSQAPLPPGPEGQPARCSPKPPQLETEALTSPRTSLEPAAESQLKEHIHDKTSTSQQASSAAQLTEYAVGKCNANKQGPSSQTPTGPPSEASVVQKSDNSFIAQLKATLNIASENQPGFTDVLKSADLKEEENPASTINSPPDAESARQPGCKVQLFFPKPKASASPNFTVPLSTNKLPLDVSRSSPSSPVSRRKVYKAFSVPPTPLQNMTSGNAGISNRPLGPNHYNSNQASNGIPGSGEEPKDEIQGIIMGGPALSPTRLGTYATQRSAELVEHRGIPSMHGVMGIATPGGMSVTGNWEQDRLSGNWHRLSAPYSPSIYDPVSTPLHPDFGPMYHPSEVRTSRIAHMAVPIETLDRLFSQIGGLSNELGLVRTELQAQTFQLQQLTAHVNLLHSQPRANGPQASVPTPTTAFRTPPSVEGSRYNNAHNDSGSPNEGHIRQASEATIRQNRQAHDARVAIPPALFSNASSVENTPVPAPISKSASGDIVNGTTTTRRNPSHPIVFGEAHGDGHTVPHSPVVTFRQIQRQQPVTQPHDFETGPVAANNGAQHRRSNSSRSQPTHYNPLVPQFRPGAGHDRVAYGNSRHDGLADNGSHQGPSGGTWGGTRNWYHHAYGNETNQD